MVALNQVIELDAPPTAYFEVADETGYTIRIKPRTVMFVGHDLATVESHFDHAIEMVRKELLAKFPESWPILWWRLRPHIEEYGDGMHSKRARLSR